MNILKLTKYSKVTLATFLIFATVIVVQQLTPKSSVLEKVLARDTVGYFAQVSLGAGCGAASMQNQEFAQQVYYSGGRICQQILGDTLDREMSGKGFCDITDKKCLFTQAYVQVSFRALGRRPQTKEELNVMQQEIDQLYEKINTTKESQ